MYCSIPLKKHVIICSYKIELLLLFLFQLCTPLHAAAASGNNVVAEILLEVGADIEARTSLGNSPLHIACLNGHVKVCVELLYSNAPIHAVNFLGQVYFYY